MAYKTADCSFAMQIGDDYVNPTRHLASVSPSMMAQISEFKQVGQGYPDYVITGYEGSLDVSGLLLGDDGNAKKLILQHHDGQNRNTAFFSIMHLGDANMLGPCGYILLSDTNIADSDGVFALNDKSKAVPKTGFEKWRYGTVIPGTRNANRAVGTTGYPDPIAEMWAVINIVKPGDLTRFEIQYKKDSATFKLAADLDSGRVIAQLKTGQLLNGTAKIATADLSGGTRSWRISTTPPTPTGAEYYVGLIHEL